MKNNTIFLSETFHFLVVKFSEYLNRHVFVMESKATSPLFSDKVVTMMDRSNTKCNYKTTNSIKHEQRPAASCHSEAGYWIGGNVLYAI